MKPEYATANDTERRRLVALLERLTAEDLNRPLPNGLTIADVLVHLAFWDRYACSVLQQWQSSGFSDSRTNFEALNAAILVLSSAIPAGTVAEMTRTAAEDVDREAEGVAPELAQAVIDGGKLRTLERAQHRREHLDQIDEALS